jgi:chromosomal replication initiator protein
MNGSSRVKAVSEARQYAMFICRELLKMPYESIGREFGGRDHATVLHACRKVKKLVDENPPSKTSLKEIEDGLKV